MVAEHIYKNSWSDYYLFFLNGSLKQVTSGPEQSAGASWARGGELHLVCDRRHVFNIFMSFFVFFCYIALEWSFRYNGGTL